MSLSPAGGSVLPSGRGAASADTPAPVSDREGEGA